MQIKILKQSYYKWEQGGKGMKRDICFFSVHHHINWKHGETTSGSNS